MERASPALAVSVSASALQRARSVPLLASLRVARRPAAELAAQKARIDEAEKDRPAKRAAARRKRGGLHPPSAPLPPPARLPPLPAHSSPSIAALNSPARLTAQTSKSRTASPERAKTLVQSHAA